ncbi:amino acid permease [Actinosynnema sp. NPDC091369]
MSETDVASAPGTSSKLRRGLSSRQISMLTLGGSIGTGLFLGAGLAVSLAGPAVIIAYVIGALITLTMVYASAEMAVAHPDANGFGQLAHRYLGPLVGFSTRWMFWAAVSLAMGVETVAVAIYVRYWWPDVPLWLPVVACAVVVTAVHLVSVSVFGGVEYWATMIKVTAIVVFLVLGVVYLTTGLPDRPAPGLSAWTGADSLLPQGFAGLWTAMIVVMFSYGGVESLSLSSAESKDPGRDLPKAARWTIVRLALFYVFSMVVILSVNATGGDLGTSPFVTLFSWFGMPTAAGLMNFVVLTAALSALNTTMFMASRTLHSLGRDRQAPAWTTRLSRRGVPTNAVLMGTLGMVVAATVSVVAPESAFTQLMGIASFGGLGTWVVILVTHAKFVRGGRPAGRIRLPGAPWTNGVAALAVAAMVVTMAFVPMFRSAWLVGFPFLLLIILLYAVSRRKSASTSTT